MRKLCYDYNMKNGRNTAGQFTEGNSGKPKGSRKKWNIIIDGEIRGDHKKVKLPVSKKRIDFDMGYPNIPRKEWGILIEGMNEVLGSNYRPNEEGRRKFIKGP